MDADVWRRCRETRADLGMQGQGREERKVLPSFPGQLGGCWHLSLKQEIEEKEQAWGQFWKRARGLGCADGGGAESHFIAHLLYPGFRKQAAWSHFIPTATEARGGLRPWPPPVLTWLSWHPRGLQPFPHPACSQSYATPVPTLGLKPRLCPSPA